MPSSGQGADVISINKENSPVSSGGSGGYDMEARVARLESDVSNIKDNVADIKADVRELRGDIKKLNSWPWKLLLALVLCFASLWFKSFFLQP